MVWLRCKHCWHPIAIMGVLDTFGHGLFCPSNMHCTLKFYPNQRRKTQTCTTAMEDLRSYFLICILSFCAGFAVAQSFDNLAFFCQPLCGLLLCAMKKRWREEKKHFLFSFLFGRKVECFLEFSNSKVKAIWFPSGLFWMKNVFYNYQ